MRLSRDTLDADASSRLTGVTYAQKISKDETRIDWSKPAREVHNHIRGLSPFPGAWFELDGVRVKVLRSTLGEGKGQPGAVLDGNLTIACGDGAVRLVQVQRAGIQGHDRRRIPARNAAQSGHKGRLMPRYKLTIEYDGAPFRGWQIQADGLTVQGVLTDAIAALAGEKTLVQGAGRTDAGVHARGQVAHVDLAREWETDTIRDALNAHLRPHPVAVLSAERAGDDFDARTSAIKRHYLYRILNRRPDLTLDLGHAWRMPRPLDARAMHAAAQRLLGKHDFTTFRSTECQAKSPEKTLDQLDVVRDGDEIRLIVSARSFLHSQVRSMVGSLALVGEGQWSADDLQAALDARDRTACGPLAPPDGLYLMRVDY